MSKLAYSQLGFRPGTHKSLTLAPDPGDDIKSWPDRIPFYLRSLFDRIPREAPRHELWNTSFFVWPFDINKGRLLPNQGNVIQTGELIRHDTAWGIFWHGELADFNEPGNYQVETDYGSTFPFTIRPRLYDRLQYGYLNYLYHQRSGFEIPGVRSATHLDDGVLDSDGTPIDAAGGWYDAGDYRKWMFLTLPNLQSLATLAERGHPGLRRKAIQEIAWGNRFYHAMISPEGQVWEDLGGGALKPGLTYENDWWFENHPGVNCDGSSDGRETDNIPGSGDERSIRTTYNPAVQFMFVRTQARIAEVLPDDQAKTCRELATRAWQHGRQRGHDRRTLFVANECWAAINLHVLDPGLVDREDIVALLEELLSRQCREATGLAGYFMERENTDGFRCIAMSAEPLMPLLRLIELQLPGWEAEIARCREAVQEYIEGFLLADAQSNTWSYPPYGVFTKRIHPEHQAFREAGGERWVRSFLHPLNHQQCAHGCGGVLLHQAVAAAKAGELLARPDWRAAAECWLQWTLGHNPAAMCLHHGVGFRCPTPFSAFELRLPDTVAVGFNGRPDDTPYLETSELIEWCTQEIWDIPQAYLAEAVLWIDGYDE